MLPALCLSNNLENLISIHSRIEAIKAARHDCTAYVLQIFALEVRALEENPNVSPTKMRELLNSFLDDPRAKLGGDLEGYSSFLGAYRGSNSSPKGTAVMTILSMAMELPVLSLPSINSPAVLRCMTAATIPYNVSRGGQMSTTGTCSGTHHDTPHSLLIPVFAVKEFKQCQLLRHVSSPHYFNILHFC